MSNYSTIYSAPLDQPLGPHSKTNHLTLRAVVGPSDGFVGATCVFSWGMVPRVLLPLIPRKHTVPLLGILGRGRHR